MTERATTESLTVFQPLRFRSVAAYGAGTAGISFFMIPTTALLLFYFTDVAGISAAIAGVILLAMRALDAVVDIPLGLMMDRLKPGRFGKFRRWLIMLAVPILLTTVALFSIPNLGSTGSIVWAVVAYAMFGILYSALDIPLGSIGAAMAQRPTDRTKLASARSITILGVQTLVTALVLPMLTPDRDLRLVFTLTILGLGIVGVILLVISGLNTSENVARPTESVRFKDGLRMLRSNRPLLIISLTAFLCFSAMSLFNGSMVYYMRDILGALPLAPLVSIISFALTLTSALLAPVLVRKLGKRRSFFIAASTTLTGTLVLLFATIVPIGFLGIGLFNGGLALIVVMCFSIQTDTVEYGEWQSGVRAEATAFSMFAFITKWAASLGGALGAFVLAGGGYVAGAAVQSDAAQWGIRMSFAGVPAILILLGILLFTRYPLSDAKFTELASELELRKSTNPSSS
ncbi:MAG: glycoside-pentoside-hexuronide (GPH):cation symporter [Pseudoclavibacter sp.]